jgi:hypothetical protein
MRINFSDLPPLMAFDPREATLEELNLGDTDQVLFVSGATWHPSKSNDGTGVISGSYNTLSYRYIDEDAARAIHAQSGIEAFVMAPADPDTTSVDDTVEMDPDVIAGGRRRRTTGYDGMEIKPRETDSGWVDDRGGAVLGGTKFGPDYKVMGQEKKWREDQGLSQEAIEVPGYYNSASVFTPHVKGSLAKRFPFPMPSPRKVL